MTSDKQYIRKSILIVDDEFDIVTLIEASLQKHGFDTLAFTDPLLAFEHFQNNSKDFALVISDIRMPSMNGYELIRKIKAERPAIKTILISAFEINKEEFSKIMPTVKIDSFITKPISLEQLVHSIENTLKEKKTEQKSIKNNGSLNLRKKI
jgi:DNA-binding NtrC family response regulator